jgi:hypothetical protein
MPGSTTSSPASSAASWSPSREIGAVLVRCWYSRTPTRDRSRFSAVYASSV